MPGREHSAGVHCRVPPRSTPRSLPKAAGSSFPYRAPGSGMPCRLRETISRPCRYEQNSWENQKVLDESALRVSRSVPPGPAGSAVWSMQNSAEWEPAVLQPQFPARPLHLPAPAERFPSRSVRPDSIRPEKAMAATMAPASSGPAEPAIAVKAPEPACFPACG